MSDLQEGTEGDLILKQRRKEADEQKNPSHNTRTEQQEFLHRQDQRTEENRNTDIL
jgi:hypothetical protein